MMPIWSLRTLKPRGGKSPRDLTWPMEYAHISLQGSLAIVVVLQFTCMHSNKQLELVPCLFLQREYVFSLYQDTGQEHLDVRMESGQSSSIQDVD